jgi:hypothetical protein
VIESVAERGCAVPTHLHRNEDEHFLVISGRYRIAIGDRILDATPGTRAAVPEIRRTAGGMSPREKAGYWQSSPREASNKSPMRSKTLHPRRLETSPRGLVATSSGHRSRDRHAARMASC